jgi:hypothetical protein
MTKARDIASAAPAPSTVSATEIGYLDGVTSAVQTQIDSKEPTLPSQTGNSGKYLTTDGSTKSWGTVSQYSLPSQTGNSGKYLTTNGTTESWGTVNLPTTWTQRRSGDGYAYNSCAYNGSNLYVAVGNSGKLVSSSDGITWTSRTSGFGSNNISKVNYGNGLFVAVGANGTITTSTDGITWTARTANMGTNYINDVHYANSLWVAVGNGGGSTNTGGITYSSDGITWTRKSQTISTIDSGYLSVMYNGTNWIVGAYSGSSSNYLYASTPSGTWTAANASASSLVQNLSYDGTRTLYSDDAGSVWFSTDTNLSTRTQLYAAFVDDNQEKNFYYGGRFYTVGSTFYHFSTTPAANNGVQGIKTELAPNTGNLTNGALSNRSNSVWVGATGYIVFDLYGGIFTSF